MIGRGARKVGASSRASQPGGDIAEYAENSLVDGIEKVLSDVRLGHNRFLSWPRASHFLFLRSSFSRYFPFTILTSEMGTVFERVCERVSSPPVGMSLDPHRNG